VSTGKCYAAPTYSSCTKNTTLFEDKYQTNNCASGACGVGQSKPYYCNAALRCSSSLQCQAYNQCMFPPQLNKTYSSEFGYYTYCAPAPGKISPTGLCMFGKAVEVITAQGYKEFKCLSYAGQPCCLTGDCSDSNCV
jgi:hypothetical protein